MSSQRHLGSAGLFVRGGLCYPSKFITYHVEHTVERKLVFCVEDPDAMPSLLVCILFVLSILHILYVYAI